VADGDSLFTSTVSKSRGTRPPGYPYSLPLVIEWAGYIPRVNSHGEVRT